MGLSYAVPIKETEKGETPFFYYASSSMQGYRPEQEDSHCNAADLTVHPSVDNDSHHCMFGVFDGHAGWVASDYCAKNLLSEVIERERLRLSEDNTASNTTFASDQLFSDAFVQCDQNLYKFYEQEGIAPVMGAGTTAITVWCRFPKNDKSAQIEVICANVGDSRAILYDGKTTVELSEDHKPTNEKEMQRINNAGKDVIMGRVNGNLAVARAFGDFRYKDTPNIADIEQAVSVEPEIKRHNLTPSSSSEVYHQFIVLACDGLWDKLSNSDVSEWIVNHLKEYNIFDESTPLTDDQLEPLHSSWITKRVQEWSNEDYSAWIVSIPNGPRRHFPATFRDGKTLCDTVQNDTLWNNLMESKTGISYPSDFNPDTVGATFRQIVQQRIETQEKAVAKKDIRSTVDKLVFLTERLIDYAVFRKRSEDNVSATIILLKNQ